MKERGAMEIERKFLVVGEPWRGAGPGTKIRQGYLSVQANAVVRVRVTEDEAWLTVKGPTHGISREELEYAIPSRDGNVLLGLCEGIVVVKARYRVPIGECIFLIDVFAGDNAGLVVAEIELAHQDDDFPRPEWLAEEVSDDPRYRNSTLSRRPYASWTD
jgi:adenylate cyclase